MSFPYIHDLGITRLKEIGKILQIPRYTTYKDPEQLRQYIQTFLTKKNQVKKTHLSKIQKTKEDIDRLTRPIAVIAAKYKNDPVRSKPRPEVKNPASDEVIAKHDTAELSELQKQLDSFKSEAQKYQLLNRKLENEAQSCRKELEATQSNLKTKSGRALDNLKKKVRAFASAEQQCKLNIAKLERSFAEQKEGKSKQFELIFNKCNEDLAKCNEDLAKYKRLHGIAYGYLPNR